MARALEGHRVAFGEMIFPGVSSKEVVDALVERYRPGREAIVHCDPGHPGRCTLVTGTAGDPYSILLIAAAAFIVAGIAAMFGLIRVS